MIKLVITSDVQESMNRRIALLGCRVIRASYATSRLFLGNGDQIKFVHGATALAQAGRLEYDEVVVDGSPYYLSEDDMRQIRSGVR